MPSSTVDRMVREDGPWQVLLPGIYLTVTGAITQEHREMAALLYAGAEGVITGSCAVRRHGLTAAEPPVVTVLVGTKVRRQSIGFVRLLRTRRLPGTHEVAGPIRYVKAARAVADTARELGTLAAVRDLAYAAVQQRKCRIAELVDELKSGPARHSAMLRTIVAELASGVRSHAEKDLQALVIRGKLPAPVYNARLYTLDGEFIAMVDAWWEEAATAGEVDSRAYHTSPSAQDRDRNRHAKLISYGVYPMHFSPYRIRSEGDALLSDLRAALERNRRTVPLPVVAVGPEGAWTPEAAARVRERIAAARAAATQKPDAA